MVRSLELDDATRVGQAHVGLLEVMACEPRARRKAVWTFSPIAPGEVRIIAGVPSPRPTIQIVIPLSPATPVRRDRFCFIAMHRDRPDPGSFDQSDPCLSHPRGGLRGEKVRRCPT